MTRSNNGSVAYVGLIVAVSMTSIDQTIVALSAPTIEADLGITHFSMQWAVNVYLIATAAVLLLGGRLSDVLGHRRMALVGIAGFGATSLLCGLAPDGSSAATWLIATRALQGMAGALMYPAAIGIVVASFTAANRARAMAAFFAITGAMTAIGPIAGGYLTQWTWRSVFWVNVPLALAAFVLVALGAAPGQRRRDKLDLLGASVVATGVALIVFGLQQSGSWGWRNGWIVSSLVAGIGLVVLFVRIENVSEQPLVNLAVFRDRGFVLATLSLLFASAAFLSAFFFLSVYGQVSLQLNALDTGVLFLKFFIGFVVAAQLGARLFDRSGGRGVLVVGGVIGVVGFARLASAVRSIPANPGAFMNSQTWPIVLAGAGIGFMLSAASTDAVNRAIGVSYGEVTAISQTMRNLGGALGIAVFASLVTGALRGNLTTAFTSLGAPASAVDAVVARLNGGTSAAGGAASDLSNAARELFAQAVRSGYADAVSTAFRASAIAMGVVVLLGLLYPRGERSSTFTGPSPEKAAQS